LGLCRARRGVVVGISAVLLQLLPRRNRPGHCSACGLVGGSMAVAPPIPSELIRSGVHQPLTHVVSRSHGLLRCAIA
jgi:hypothetical protein